MTKYMVECERDRVRFNRIKKKAWALITIRGRLYRGDDRLMIKDRGSDKALLIYDIDQSQPRTCNGEYVDPDFTRGLILQGKIANTKRKIVGSIGEWSIEKILTGIIIAGGVVYWVLMQLGL